MRHAIRTTLAALALGGLSAPALAQDAPTKPIASLDEALEAQKQGHFVDACSFLARGARTARDHAEAAWCFHWWAHAESDEDLADEHRESEVKQWEYALARCAPNSDCERSATAKKQVALEVRDMARAAQALEAAKKSVTALRELAIDNGVVPDGRPPQDVADELQALITKLKGALKLKPKPKAKPSDGKKAPNV